jgi:hypothetical protein
MGTRSAIGIIDGSRCKAVYCHWDGYIEHNGIVLNQHYQDPAKVEQLIGLGSISSLGPEIGEKHDFDSHSSWYNTCLFYGRDRGDTDVDHIVVDSADELFKEFSWCEYFYIMKDGIWYVSSYGGPWERLDTAIVASKLEA